MGCGMSKTTIRFTRLSKNLGRDDQIKKPITDLLFTLLTSVIFLYTAILSVSNKEGLVDFGKKLHELGFKLIASGGTAKELRSADIPVG